MKIIIADDHTLFRDGLRHILARLAPDVLLLEADTYSALADLLREHSDAALALVDLNMPERDRYPAIGDLLALARTTPVVVLSGSEDAREIRRTLDAGVMGFIPKREKADVVLGALRLVLSGGVYVPPMLVGAPAGPRVGSELTPRQYEVLRCLYEGYANKEIARRLGMTEATVKAHITAIFKALNVSNRAQAVRAAEQTGLLAGY